MVMRLSLLYATRLKSKGNGLSKSGSPPDERHLNRGIAPKTEFASIGHYPYPRTISVKLETRIKECHHG
ncbi:hypothetical protein DESC_190113 [Desulfosarcina cetonica]|nr:hypothetical protein DESC_190113 [Desulfosarcina cetonica]